MALAEHYYGTGLSEAPDLDDLLELVARGRPAWMADALCREYPEVNFFPALGESAEPAKAVCGRCAVRAECAAYGASEAAGIWGGLSRRGRREANVGRIVSDGAPARLREVGLVETRSPTPTLSTVQFPVSPSSVAVSPTGDTSPMGDSISTFVEPAPVRRVEHRAFPNGGNDDDRPPAPASCARCPMAVGKGKTLCRGCERDSAPPS